MKDRSPPTTEELQMLKKIYVGNKICLSLFVLFLPACLIYNYLFPGKLTVFAIAYVLITGCISYPVSFVKCPRCKQNFNMYHPFDWKHSLVNDGGGSGMGNCIYCGFPFTKRKKNRSHTLSKKFFESISKIVYCEFGSRKQKKDSS